MLIKRQFYFAFVAVLVSLIIAMTMIVFMHVRLQRMEEVRTVVGLRDPRAAGVTHAAGAGGDPRRPRRARAL